MWRGGKENVHRPTSAALLIFNESVKQTPFAYGWMLPWMQFMCGKPCSDMPLNERSRLTFVDYVAVLGPTPRC